MKRYLLFFALLLGAVYSWGQSSVDKINTIYNPNIIPTCNKLQGKLNNQGSHQTQDGSGVIVLTFEGVGNLNEINDYYNGGGGTNYGVHFNSNALGLVDASHGGSGNCGNEPSEYTIMFFLDGAAIMNVAAGFNTGFSFYYASAQTGTVSIYDGLDATGTLLASGNYSATSNPWYYWATMGINFTGTAKSVKFDGVANECGFDDVTFGSSQPDPPNPPPDPTSISVSVNPLCSGSSTQLTCNGASGTVYWSTASCKGTTLTTGNPISVAPSSTTTYWAWNYSNSLPSNNCVSATVNLNNPVTTPSSATGTPTGLTTANLSWGSSSGTTPITYYWVVGTTPSVAYGSETAQGSATGTSASTSALTKSTTYYLRVYANNTCGNSSYVTSSSFRTSSDLTYAPGSNGTISGTLYQIITNGGNGTSVTAIPNVNYNFVNWSDGSASNPRQDNNVTSSISVTANFAANRLVFGTQPVSTVAGANIPVTVKITDTYGNVMTSATNAVTLAFQNNPSIGGAGVLHGTLTVNANNGIATFSDLWIDKTGIGYTLKATAASPIITVPVSNSFNINPAAIDHFTVAGITNPVVAGVETTPVVTAYDLYNNIKTDYTGTIQFTTTSPLKVLPANYSYLPGDNGVHTFTNQVILKTTGTWSVTVTGTVDGKTGSQTGILVNPAALDHFTLVTQHSQVETAGSDFTVTASAYDQFNNLKTDYNGVYTVNWTTTATSSPNHTPRIIPAGGSQPFVTGTATIDGFTLFNSAETPTITLQDNATGKTGTTPPITVLSLGLDNFLVVTGTSQVSGIPFSVTVTAHDIYYNTVITYAGSIRFKSSNDAQVSYPAGVISMAGFNGVRVFTNGVTIGASGAYWLRAADATYAFKSGQQNFIVVAPGAFAPGTIPIDPSTESSVIVDTHNRIAGQYVHVTVTPRDAQGNLLCSCQDITVLLDGVATDHTGTIHVTNVGDGTYTADVMVTKTTSQVISAELGSTLFTQTQTINVTNAPASYLAITGNSTQVAGNSQVITVTAYDAFNNVAVDYTGSKSLTFSGANPSPTPSTNPTVAGTNFGTPVSMTFTLGVATGTMYLYKVETAYITTTDGLLNADAHKLTVNVTQAPTSYLAITGSSSQTAGTTQLITIGAYDQYNNLSTAYTGGKTLTFSGADPSPAPSTNPTVNSTAFGSGTSVVFSNGQATVPMALYDAETANIDAVDGSYNADAHKLNVVVSQAAPYYLAITGNSTQVAGTTQTITISAFDEWNNPATNYTGNKSLTFSGAGNSPAPPYYPTVNLVDFGITTIITFTGGQATASMALYNVETSYITTTDGGITANSHKLVVNVTYSTPAYLKITGNSTEVAGDPQTITITAYDAYNNVATGYSGNHDLTFSGANVSPSGSNPTVGGINFGSTTTLNFTGGSVTASMTLYKTETALVSASDGSINASTHYLSVIVSNATPNYLAITGSGTQTAGSPQNIAVTAYDLYGNIATSYTGNKSLTFTGAGLSPSGMHPTVLGTNFGSATTVTFSSGSATSLAMFLYKAETAQITAADLTINADLHELTVVVSNAAANYLAITGSGTQTAGTSQNITITASDIYGNTAVDYNGDHTLTFSGANSSPSGSNPTVNSTNFGTGTTVTFAAGVTSPLPPMYLYKAETVDINASDAVAGINASAHKLHVVVSNALAHYLAITGSGTQTAGSSQNITITAYDLYGNTAVDYTGSQNLVFSGANPSPSGSYPTVNSSNFGSITAVTFSSGVTSPLPPMFLYRTETVDISASDVNNGINATSHKLHVVVSNASPNYLAVTGTGTQVAGTSQTITITAYDTYGNVATSYTGSHNLTFSGANPSPSGTHPTANAVNFGTPSSLTFSSGSVTTAMYLYKAETATVTTTDGSLNANAHSLSVIVYNATANYFAITGTGTQVAGTSQNITITAYDLYANVATDYTGAHTLTFSGANPSPAPSYHPTVDGTNFGTGTSVTFSLGIASLQPMVLYKVETAYINATEGSINANSNKLTVNVTEAPTYYFSLNSPPDIVAGGDRAAYTVTRLDHWNNPTTTGAQVVYIFTNSTGVNARFYNALTGGSVITQVTIAGGTSSANFWYYDEKTGNWTITASDHSPADGSTGIIDATDNITVLPTVLMSFNVAGIANPECLGTWQSVTVTALDTYNNIKTNYGGTITWSNTDVGATNPPIYTYVPADYGVHTFTDAVRFSAPGTWWLTALDLADPSKYGAQANIVVSQPITSVNATATPITCRGSSDGFITTSVVGGTSPYAYVWSNGGTTSSISGLSAGIYTVTVNDAGGCSQTASATVLESPTLLAVSASATPITCRGNHDGIVTSSVSGGTAGYTYHWNNGATTTSISGLSAGTYYVTVTDAYLCQKTASATVLESPTLLAVSASATPITCLGSYDGIVTASASGGTSGYTYAWSGPNSYTGTGNPISGLASGTYYVTVTDAYLCQKTASATVLESPTMLTVSANATPITCTGSHDGVVTASAGGGTAGYTYSWSGPGTYTNTGNPITGLAAGTYYVTVTDAYLCQKTASATVLESQVLLAVNATPTPITCRGANDGVVNANVSGGTGPFSYAWSGPGSYVNTGNPVTGLSAGTYYVTVTDAYLCAKTASAVVLESPTLLSVSATATPITCYGSHDGIVTATASGGTAGYTYAWSSPNGYTGTGNPITGLEAGVYYVTVTDAYQCQKTTSALVEEAESLLAVSAIPTPITCTGSHDGAVVANAMGGYGAYTYYWTGPDNYSSTSNPITGLYAGTYYVTVTDAFHCQKTALATVLESAVLLSVTATPTPITCRGSNDGIVTASAGGGTGPFTYSWSGPGTYTNTGNPITGLSAGTYYVTVTDSYQCRKTASAIVLESESLLAVNAIATPITCTGNHDGIVTSSASGGAGGYTYNWSNGATTTSISGLSAGTYTVTVTDAYLCQKTASATVLESPLLLAVSASPTPITCTGSNDGVVTASVSGGTGPFTYSWSGPDTYTNTGNPITGLIAGTYYVTATDAYLCQKTASATVLESQVLLAVSATPTPITCTGASDGVVTASVSGGTGPFTYSWSGPGTYTQTGNPITGLSAGTYYVTVTDAYLCHKTASATVLESPVLLAVSATPTPITCHGAGNGIVTASASGGTSDYTYAWSGPNGYTASGNPITGLQAGTYTVTVTDAYLCSKTASAVVLEPDVLTVGGTVTSNVRCYGGNDGAINITVGGGTTNYTYFWSNSATSQNLSGLTAGSYYVTVTDARNCTATGGAYTVTQPDLLVISGNITNVICYGYSTGAISASCSGGVTPYTYLWSNNSTATSISNLSAGSYTLTVTDEHSCTMTNTFTVTQPAAWGVTIGGAAIACCGSQGGSYTYTADVTGTYTNPLTYQWSVTGGTIQSGSNTASITIQWSCCGQGNISLVVNMPNNCQVSASKSITVNIPPSPVITGPTMVVSGDNVNYCTTPVQGLTTWIVTGGTLNSGQGTDCINVTWNQCNVCPNGSVTVIQSANGCTGSTTVTVTILPGSGNLTGYMQYDNPYGTGLNGVTITLTDPSTGNIVATTITGPNTQSNNQPGYYSFPNLSNGSYHLTASYNGTWGGNNATDALIVQLKIIGLYPLQYLRLNAADVNASGTLTGLDALYIKLRTVGEINSYPAGDWVFTDTTFTLAVPAEVDLKGLCVGDVNGSFIPDGNKDGSFLDVVSDNVETVPVNKPFTYTVLSNSQADLGAMTLFMNYDPSKFMVMNLQNASESMKYKIEAGRIAIAWSDTHPLDVKRLDTLVSIQMKALSPIDEPADIFSLGTGGEFADIRANRYDNFTLNMPKVITSKDNNAFYIMNFPNPFNNSTEIIYSIPEQADVKLVITNILGDVIKIVTDGHQDAGNYHYIINAAECHMQAGTYIYKIIVNGNSATYTKVNKMVFTY